MGVGVHLVPSSSESCYLLSFQMRGTAGKSLMCKGHCLNFNLCTWHRHRMGNLSLNNAAKLDGLSNFGKFQAESDVM